MDRLLPASEWINKLDPSCLISIDTYRKTVAKQALEQGAHLINDISGGEWDPGLPLFLAQKNVPYILMHMQGKPENMQNKPTYADVTKDIYQWFSQKLFLLDQMGLKDVIIDPGFGFGKTLEQNYRLLNDLDFFQQLQRPILVGISRKGMIQRVIEEKAENSLNGSTAAHVLALQKGAAILRVHDVKAAKEAVAIVDYYQKQ
jgi:dihydropteroate synthase